MQVIRNEMLLKIDVDDTLVIWGKIKRGEKAVAVTDPYSGEQVYLRPHQGHIKVLKDRKARGAHITVWSAGGYLWAQAVVKALNLEKYVDVCSSKPIMYIDDKEAHEILGERLYLGIDNKYGT